jgi:hypothetical protein
MNLEDIPEPTRPRQRGMQRSNRYRRVRKPTAVFGIPLGLILDRFLPGILMVYGVGIAWLGIATLLQLRSVVPSQPTGLLPGRPTP